MESPDSESEEPQLSQPIRLASDSTDEEQRIDVDFLLEPTSEQDAEPTELPSVLTDDDLSHVVEKYFEKGGQALDGESIQKNRLAVFAPPPHEPWEFSEYEPPGVVRVMSEVEDDRGVAYFVELTDGQKDVVCPIPILDPH